MTYAIDSTPLWQPDPATVGDTRMAMFMRATGHGSYADLWQWSVDQPEVFWSTLWNFCGAVGEKGTEILVDRDRSARDAAPGVAGDIMRGARWFPQARLNYAENLLKNRDDGEALVFWGEDKVRRRMSRAELYAEVARFQAFLVEAGVGEGDRVAGYLPNLPETLVAMLAATALGAIWSSASPDFGVQGVLDRFGQIEPKVLVCVNGYWYNGKPVDCLEKNAEVVAQMPTLLKTVVVPYLAAAPDIGKIANAVGWNDIAAVNPQTEVIFKRVAFDHPLFIMFSSGTTGVPKCIVHCHGGVLLQHLKEHQLHSDVRPGDRLFYFTTCGWMMWNWLVSGLAAGATLLLYDGSPFAAGNTVLFDFAAAERMTHFGTSAKFIDAAAKLGLTPGRTHDLSALRAMFSTGSPLSPEGFDWVYREIKQDILLASISGGTDIISCFVLGNPVLPVYRGEIQCRGLGMAVNVFDDEGTPVRSQKGELVCTKPFPVMPVGFWNDPDGKKYHAAYFERFDEHLVPRRLLRADRARRHDHLRPLGRDAQPRRRAHRHRRNLPPGRAVAGNPRIAGHRPGLAAGQERRRARRALRQAAGWPGAGRRVDRAHQETDQGQHDAAPRSGEGRAGAGHPAHQVGQDRRTGRAQRRARPAGQERRGAGQSGSAGVLPQSGGTGGLRRAGVQTQHVVAKFGFG